MCILFPMHAMLISCTMIQESTFFYMSHKLDSINKKVRSRIVSELNCPPILKISLNTYENHLSCVNSPLKFLVYHWVLQGIKKNWLLGFCLNECKNNKHIATDVLNLLLFVLSNFVLCDLVFPFWNVTQHFIHCGRCHAALPSSQMVYLLLIIRHCILFTVGYVCYSASLKNI